MSLAGGARQDSLLFGITTAGVKTATSGQDSLCYSLYQYGQRIAKGENVDPSFSLLGGNRRNQRVIIVIRNYGKRLIQALAILLILRISNRLYCEHLKRNLEPKE